MLRVLLIVLAVPAIWFGISTWSIETEFASLKLLQTSSIYTAALGIGIPVLVRLGAIFAGSNRARLARVFPFLLRVVVVLLAVLTVAHGVILTYAAYVVETHAADLTHFAVTGVIGLSALPVAYALINSNRCR